jgi:PKD repeat protein
VPFAPSSPSPCASRLRGRTLLAALLLAGCTGGAGLLLPGDGQPAGIEVVRGDGQSGRVGEPLAAPLVVEVTDSRGRPVEGARVAFDFAGPGGDIVPDTATTDANGEADARIVLGTTVGTQTGQAQLVTTEESQQPKASFTATALSENADGIAAVSGDEQRAPAGSTLPDPLVVEVSDAFGNPIPGVPVSWTAEGGGSVSQPSTTTNNQGRASVERTLGPAAGAQTTLATSEGLAGSPVTFTHTATAGNAAGLSIVSGNNQTATAGSQLPADLVVRLVDGTGNGVPDAAVTWVVGLGGGDVTPENGTTDAAGRASARLTLGPNPGENRVDAVVSGVGIVSFKAIGTRAGPVPTGTSITSDSPDPSVAGTTFTVEFQVSSEGGTPTGTVTVSDGTPTCTGTLSNGTGSCQLTLNQTGDRTLRATYAGAPGFSGSSDTEPHRVNPPVPGNRAPDADYNWHCEGLTCQFTDASQDPDGSIASWSWNFGDGRPGSNERNPSHAFPAPGEYQVTLTVTDNGGATDASTAGVEVEAPPAQVLELRAQPSSSAIIGDQFERQPEVQLRAGGDDVERAGVIVSVSVATGGGTLGGTTTTTTDGGGRARFNDLSINGATGPHTLRFSADGFASVTSNTIEVRKASSETRITSHQPEPSIPDQPVTVAFSVTGSDATPTGTVTVTGENVAEPCTGSLSSGSGSCSIRFTAQGNHRITAAYSGDDRFEPSDDDASHQVDPAPQPNQPPAAADDAATTDAGTPVTIDVLANDTDPDGDDLTVSSVGDPPNGSTVIDGNGTITYTPDPGFSGANDVFTYTVSDGSLPDDATVTVTVRAPPPPNQAPSFTLDNSDLSANMGESRIEPGWAENISPGPPSESGQVVTFLVGANPSDLFTVPPSISQDGTLTFTTSTGEGDSVVTVRLQDNGGTANDGVDTSDPQTFTIHISGGGGG